MAGQVARRFGERMRQRRDELGLRQREVATRIGADKQAVSDWERGAREPSDRYKSLIVKALEVDDVSYFYKAITKETPDPFAANGDGIGQDAEPDDDRLDQLLAAVKNVDERLKLLRAESAARDAEALKRIEELQRTIQGTQRRQQQ